MSLHSQRHLHSDPRPHPLTEVVSARGLPPLFQAHETEDLKDTVLTLKSTVPTMQALSRGQTVEILRGQEAHTASRLSREGCNSDSSAPPSVRMWLFPWKMIKHPVKEGKGEATVCHGI